MNQSKQKYFTAKDIEKIFAKEMDCVLTEKMYLSILKQKNTHLKSKNCARLIRVCKLCSQCYNIFWGDLDLPLPETTTIGPF